MYIISTFEHSTYLELAISELEHKGIDREKILAVPLDKRTEERKLFDSINQSDGISLFDAAAILGAMCMVLGVIYGYVLKWGPILWGLIGLIAGAVLGFTLDFIQAKKFRNKLKNKNRSSEVVIIIYCDNEQLDLVENTLWNNFALGVGLFNK